jgi:hypothetical protein
MFRRWRKPKKKKKEDADQPAPARQDPSLERAREESDSLEQQRRAEEERLRAEEEKQNREIADIDAQVDAQMSDNSEEFLRNIEQPGGE